MTEKKVVLRTEHLKAFYVLEMQGTQKIVKAVNDVDMQIYENEIYGIAGESGCGKTTLLKALFNDIVPPLRLISGKIYYRIDRDEEVDVTRMSPEEMRALDSNKPCLLVVLAEPKAEKRWVLTALP